MRKRVEPMTREMRHTAPALRRTALALTAALILCTSCIEDEYEGPDPNLPTRTVVVYLAGDNDLEDLPGAVEQLRRAWTYTGNRCLVYYDAADALPVLLSLRGGCSTWPEPWVETVAVYAEENSASGKVFGRVVRDVVRMYPADSYGLVYASHATGWLPAGTLAAPGRTSRSIGHDADPGTMGGGAETELADFVAAIPDGQFDFIVFEACLMAGVEVAYALREKTDYLVVSSAELLAPGFIPVYGEAFGALMNTALPVEQSLARLAGAYYDYMNTRDGAWRSATLSILRTENMNLLAARFGEVLRNRYSPTLSSSDIAELQHFDRPGSYGDSPAAPRYFDLEHYAERLAPPQYVEPFRQALREVVVWRAATPEFMAGYNGFRVERHSGLTTYIEQECFPPPE